VVRQTKIDLGDLGKHVTRGLQQQFDTSDGMKQYGLHVADGITLINVTGNEYRGLVTVRTNKLNDVPVGIILYADGSNMIYHIDPESAFFMFPTSMKIVGYWAKFNPARSARPYSPCEPR
jgi:hypothetical protein